MLVYLVLLGVIFGSSCVFEKILDRKKCRNAEAEKTPIGKLIRRINMGLGLTFLVVLASPLFYEYPGLLSGKKPITFQNDQIVYHSYGCLEWPWQSTPSLGSREATTVLFGDQAVTSLMTDNPKVRKLKYLVKFNLSDPVKYFRAPERRSAWHNQLDLQNRLIYQLYEFNDKRSSELVKFYNPESADQQLSFKEMVKQFLDPVFAEDGVEVLSASFSLVE